MLLRRGLFLQWVCLNWAAARLGAARKRPGTPVHILFCTVDHYEPGTRNATADEERERVEALLTRYPPLADRHRDAAGHVPKRTWFFPPHYHRHGSLPRLVSLCERGYGEIELHLHHGRRKPDTGEHLRRTLRRCVEEYSLFGIFGTEAGRKRYAFIHGDWALGNSRGGRYCGVNDELPILKETGCYADFTFPSLTAADPLRVNTIFYARDMRRKMQTLAESAVVSRGGTEPAGLMIVQGPIYPYVMESGSTRRSTFRLRALGDSLSTRYGAGRRRIDAFIQSAIHVRGKPDWIVVKTSTHGATNADAVLGRQIDDVWTYLEEAYNDGANYVLHYVTARELYNMIKAAEAGEPSDDPEPYRNYRVAAPEYNSRAPYASASSELMELVYETY